MFYSIKRFGLEFANEIDRRTYEEAMYNKSLDPAMDPVERYDLIRAFLFRKNEDTISALNDDRPDAEVRQHAFFECLYEAIMSDEEPFYKKGRAIYNALKSNNAEELLVAICGWNSDSLAKRAMLIPDDGRKFLDDETPATLIVLWSDGTESKEECFVDSMSNKVYGYSCDIFSAPCDTAEIVAVVVELQPDYTEEKQRRFCITKEERESRKDYISYWYSTNPDDAEEPEPSVWVECPYD